MSSNTSAKITLTVVRKLQPGEIVRDTEVKGFGVRRQKSASSYFLKTRIKGRERWITIGRHGSPWTPDAARKQALKYLSEIAAGQDPAGNQEKFRTTPDLKAVAEQFMAEHGVKLKPKTRHDYDRLFRKVIFPVFGSRKIDDLSRSDMSRFHSLKAETPRQANFALAVLSKLMNWSEAQGLRVENSNPCKGILKYKEKRRERFLSLDEFAQLGEVLDDVEKNQNYSIFAIAAIRLLIFTGARLGEVLELKWEYIDLDRQILWLPDSKTGQKTINLNEEALAVLERIPRIEGNVYVIAGQREGCHLVNLNKPWAAIRKTAGIEDVRLHDLRHSYASVAVASGASLPMIGKLLGHMQTQTTARYAHLSNDPIQQVNKDVGLIIGRAMAGGREKLE